MSDERTLIDAAVEHLPTPVIEEIKEYQHLRLIAVPQGFSVEKADLERYAAFPSRIRQKTTHETPTSFAEYVVAFKDGTTRVFASLAQRKVVALIDYHDKSGDASWTEHRAEYPAAFDDAFAAWHKIDGKTLPQRDFATFLEDRAEDAVTPEPARLMEVASSFEAIRSADFKTAINLATGEREFKYDVKDKASGAVTCPKVIVLNTPIFYGCEATKWAARLAYDISDGKLTFAVKIHRLPQLLDDAFQRLVDAMAVEMPGVPLHRGTV